MIRQEYFGLFEANGDIQTRVLICHGMGEERQTDNQ